MYKSYAISAFIYFILFQMQADIKILNTPIKEQGGSPT